MTERRTTSRKSIPIFVIFASLCCAFIVVGAWASTGAMRSWFGPARGAEVAPQAQAVIVQPQPGSPLRIVSADTETNGEVRLMLHLTLQNQSDRAIRAYAITLADSAGGGEAARVEFVNLTQAGLILQPTQTRLMSVTAGQRPSSVGIRLAVDFVEFADGHTWGTDTHNSRDRLAGQRAGGRAERQRLRELSKTKGHAAAAEATAAEVSEEDEAPAKGGRSEEWLQGFRSGVGSVRARARRAWQAGGKVRLEAELDAPFDSSEGRRP